MLLNYFGGAALHVASISENPEVTRRPDEEGRRRHAAVVWHDGRRAGSSTGQGEACYHAISLGMCVNGVLYIRRIQGPCLSWTLQMHLDQLGCLLQLLWISLQHAIIVLQGAPAKPGQTAKPCVSLCVSPAAFAICGRFGPCGPAFWSSGLRWE